MKRELEMIYVKDKTRFTNDALNLIKCVVRFTAFKHTAWPSFKAFGHLLVKLVLIAVCRQLHLYRE